MKSQFDPRKNYEASKKAVGYIPRKNATQQTYNDIGFMSGLEVHQQLKTKHKLFCSCPAGIYHHHSKYDAEVIRHMRPTLSELGEYDGTALMEFKTRKNIVYRLKNETTCTYEVDDTPPFPLDREALEYAIEISLLSKLNIVGEVHITRKQYLDGSIPTGFQRTGIIGVEGEIYIKDRPIRLIQLSLEEDSCREISDIGHVRIYNTDRLGMPLIETVTYPDMKNPDEVMEACNYIRFLNRSTGKVRTGIGAGRQDVNVSCAGGTRVEIKGVAHTRWIPELTHVEVFRQWALLKIRDRLKGLIPIPENWKINFEYLDFDAFELNWEPLKIAKETGQKLIAINLPYFKGILSHFTQPNQIFANEISDRLKVIACLEKPNILHSEQFKPIIKAEDFEIIASILKAKEQDAQIVIWGHEEDMKTALETIEERCKMALLGVPNETRKSLENGATIFERVLPGADRMYPDTDSAPIPLEDNYIDELRKRLPDEVMSRYHQLKEWKIPEDTYIYILKRNLFPVIKRIILELKLNPTFVGTFFGHTLKHVEGQFNCPVEFNYEIIYALFKYLTLQKINVEIARKMLTEIYEHPKMDFESVLTSINFKPYNKEKILSNLIFLKEKFHSIRWGKNESDETNWILGQLRPVALGNITFSELKADIENPNKPSTKTSL